MARPGEGERQRPPLSRVNPWATGFTVFAGVMLVAIGAAHFISGLSAVLNDTFYVVGANYRAEGRRLDVGLESGWARASLADSAGAGVLSGQSLVARIVGVVVAVASIVWSFLFDSLLPRLVHRDHRY